MLTIFLLILLACTQAVQANLPQPALQWSRNLSFRARSLTLSHHQILITSDSPPHMWSLDKKNGEVAWSLPSPMGSVRNPSLWNNMLALFPNSTSLLVLNPDNGEIAWQIGPPFPAPPGDSKGSSGEMQPSSLLEGSQRLLSRPLRVGPQMLCLRGDGAVLQVDMEHRSRIAVKVESPLHNDLFLARPAMVQDELWICSRRGYLFEVSLETGQIMRSRKLKSSDIVASGHLVITADLLTVGERVILASEDGTVFGIKPDNPRNSWKLPVGRGDDTFSAAGESLFSPIPGGPKQCLIATRQDLRCLGVDNGDTQWRRHLSQGISSRPYSNPEKNRVYVTTNDAQLLEISTKDGSTLRSWKLASTACTTPVFDDDNLFVGLVDGSVECYSLK